MAGDVLNIKVCSPLKLRSGLIGNYHAICHYSYKSPLPPSVRKTADTHSSTFGFCQHTDQNKKPTELEFCQRSKKKQKSNAIY